MLLARRNLLRDRSRFGLSVAAVAVAVALIILLAGYRNGVYRQASAYLDHAPGSIVVAEAGIRDFLGTSSALPPGAEAAVAATPGVARVVPIVSQFVVFERHGRKDGFFLIGYEPGTGGGPWSLRAGREPERDDEIVLDRTAAAQHDIAVGDPVTVLDRSMTVVGLSDDTTFWAGSIAFAPISTLQTLLRAPGLLSFLLVTPTAAGGDADVLARLAGTGVEALPKQVMVDNDRRLLARVYDAPIGLMVGIAFVVGILVVGLVIYAATVERRREYGALKAIGAGRGALYRIVVLQALLASAVGTVVGVAIALAGGQLLTAWRPQFRVDVDPAAVVAVLGSSVLVAVLAALLPARTIARLEPAEVFR